MTIGLLDRNSFNQVLTTSSLPILVFFTASWDTYGKKLIPILEELSNELSDQLQIFSVDTDSSPELNTQYRLRSIPSFIIFKNGEQVAQQAGGGTKTQINQFLINNL